MASIILVQIPRLNAKGTLWALSREEQQRISQNRARACCGNKTRPKESLSFGSERSDSKFTSSYTLSVQKVLYSLPHVLYAHSRIFII